MQSTIRILFVFGALFTAALPASAAEERIPVTSMGMREIQTRSFDDTNTKAVLKAAIDMLQDGGFTIERTDADLGLVVGRRASVRGPSAGKRALKYIGAAFSYGLIGLIPLKQTDEIEASANVSAIDEDSVRVRIALQRRYLDKNGRLKKTETVNDGRVYQDLFEIFGRSLFVSQGAH